MRKSSADNIRLSRKMPLGMQIKVAAWRSFPHLYWEHDTYTWNKSMPYLDYEYTAINKLHAPASVLRDVSAVVWLVSVFAQILFNVHIPHSHARDESLAPCTSTSTDWIYILSYLNCRCHDYTNVLVCSFVDKLIRSTDSPLLPSYRLRITWNELIYLRFAVR